MDTPIYLRLPAFTCLPACLVPSSSFPPPPLLPESMRSPVLHRYTRILSYIAKTTVRNGARTPVSTHARACIQDAAVTVIQLVGREGGGGEEEEIPRARTTQKNGMISLSSLNQNVSFPRASVLKIEELIIFILLLLFN